MKNGDPAKTFIFEVFKVLLNRSPSQREVVIHTERFRGRNRNISLTLREFISCGERKSLLKRKRLDSDYLFSSIARSFRQDYEPYFPKGYFLNDLKDEPFENLEPIPEDWSIEKEHIGGDTKNDLSQINFQTNEPEPFEWRGNKPKDIKVAVCLTGHSRKTKTFTSIRKKIIDVLDADVFIHTWEGSGEQMKGRVGPKPNDRNKIKQNIFSPLNPTSTQVESNGLFLKNIAPKIIENREKIIHYAYHRPHRNVGGAAEPKYILSQMYGWSQSFKLLKEYEEEQGFKYDYVVKLRLDFGVQRGWDQFKDIGKKLVEDLSLRKEQDIVFIPQHELARHGHPLCSICFGARSNPQVLDIHTHDREVCDIFAHGGRDAMETYMTTFDRWEDILNEMFFENYKLLIENISSDSLKKQKFKIFKMNHEWAEKDHKTCCNINEKNHQNLLLHCFYPERFLMFSLKNNILAPSYIAGRIQRS